MFRKGRGGAGGGGANEGKYFLMRSQLSNLVLDVVDGSTETNSTITTADETGADTQYWSQDIINQFIRNKATGYCLNLDFNKALIVSEFDPANNDLKWEIAGNQIIHVSSGKAVDLAAGDKGAGARVIVWDKHDGENQKWSLEFQERVYFWIKSKFNGKVLDIAGDSEEPGTEVITYDQKKKRKGPVDNQLWCEDPRGVIRSKLGPPGGFALDSSDGDIKTAVYDPSNENHIWVIQGETIPNGPAHPGLILDIKGKKKRNGANLVGYEDHGGSNQRWEFIIDEEED